MKKAPVFIVIALLVLFACSKENSQPKAITSNPKADRDLSQFALMGLDSPFISIDTANKMIGSYLNSISSNEGDLKSLIVDGDALRYYLADPDIKHVKLMFAHKLNYINNGNNGEYAGYEHSALTIVIAGYGEDNNYIYSPQGAVLDFCQPCPDQCPPNGTAAGHTLPASE